MAATITRITGVEVTETTTVLGRPRTVVVTTETAPGREAAEAAEEAAEQYAAGAAPRGRVTLTGTAVTITGAGDVRRAYSFAVRHAVAR